MTATKVGKIYNLKRSLCFSLVVDNSDSMDKQKGHGSCSAIPGTIMHYDKPWSPSPEIVYC
jgi:hypothetical protein